MIFDNPSEVVILADAKNSFVTVVDNPSAVTVITGVQGLQGASSNGSALSIRFAWGDATPALIATVPANKTVLKVEVVVLTGFDVPSGITVGDSADHERLFNVPDLDLTQAGTYQARPNCIYIASTPVNLYLSLGSGGAIGKGIVLIYIEE